MKPYQGTHQISVKHFEGEIVSAVIASSSQDRKQIVLTVYPNEKVVYHIYRVDHIVDTVFSLEDAVKLYNRL